MRAIRFTAVLLLLLLPAVLLRAAETEDYEISHYVLSFDTREGAAEVRVQMEITYRIRSGTKSAGFKYIGSYNATNFTGRDEGGAPIRVWVDRPGETRLNWSFDPAGRGEKKVVLTFDIPGALTGSRDSNTLNASWAGIFRVPVRDAIYRLILPDDSERDISPGPGAVIRVEGGRRIVELRQDSIGRESFRVTFAPGLADYQMRSTPPSSQRRSRLFLPMMFIIFFILIFFVVMATAAKRAGGKKGSEGGTFSSCAGASSCGGGGCGGGGCGG